MLSDALAAPPGPRHPSVEQLAQVGERDARAAARLADLRKLLD